MSKVNKHKVLIGGSWRGADAEDQFYAYNPTTGEALDDIYPVSSWHDCEQALEFAASAFEEMQKLGSKPVIKFLEIYAELIEKNTEALVEMAHLETGLPKMPRLAGGEIPRTVAQLRLAAQAASESSWCVPTIDSKNNIRSMLEAIGPVVVFGPNNFPFAFGSASGGDFAAAIAAGNPVIAKAHPSHPGTTRIFAELAHQAVIESGLPVGAVQLIYAMSNRSGLKMVADPRIGATGFTGSRGAGLALKSAADRAGKPIYLELSSINPVVVLPGAITEKGEAIAQEFTDSCTMVAGQLCTKPGLLIVPEGEAGDDFVTSLADKFNQAPVGTLLSALGGQHIDDVMEQILSAGAKLLTNSQSQSSERFCHANALMSVKAVSFLTDVDIFQQEMFGNASLVIRTSSIEQTKQVINALGGNLTGCIYSHSEGLDDKDYDVIETVLKNNVGRIINDKMPTGVLVSSAMNHGGPFPSTGHPGFTAVGLPAAIKRFGALKCYDNVRSHRLPALLADKSPGEAIWRLIDGQWTTGDVS